MQRRAKTSFSCFNNNIEEVPSDEIIAQRGYYNVLSDKIIHAATDSNTSSIMHILTAMWNFFIIDTLYHEYNPTNVLTSNIHETWNARCFAPASIVLDLKKKRKIVSIDLMPDMLPETGVVKHVIVFRDTTSANEQCSYFQYHGTASNCHWIHVDTTPHSSDTICYYNRIEIITTLSPSWVAWRQIKIFAVEVGYT